MTYRTSMNSCCNNYSFFCRRRVRQVFKVGKYSKEETINYWEFEVSIKAYKSIKTSAKKEGRQLKKTKLIKVKMFR